MIPAIILAGGLGTRLRDSVSDLPKPMAPIEDKPFLNYVLDYLIAQGVSEVILATGYMHEAIEKYYGESYRSISIQYSVEESPMGTGGAINKALDLIDDQAFVINGDTFFQPNLSQLLEFHNAKNANLTLALKLMHDSDRYGAVTIDKNGRIIQFQEKAFREECIINAGIYVVNKSLTDDYTADQKFSWEQDIMEAKVNTEDFYGLTFEWPFIDIGIPEDYEKAQRLLPLPESIDTSWTLFLDRDGVINNKIENGYVTKWEDFHFIKGSEKAVVDASHRFGRIIVVTNQQGVSKNLMSAPELEDIHFKMQDKISSLGGKIDSIYACTDLASANKNCRKPAPSMGLKAKEDFTEIEFYKSVMIGDSDSDIEFGKNLGMYTVRIGADSEKVNDVADMRYPSLAAWDTAWFQNYPEKTKHLNKNQCL